VGKAGSALKSSADVGEKTVKAAKEIAKPSLTAHKEALRAVQEEVGKLP
jgi:hypothetical protein